MNDDYIYLRRKMESKAFAYGVSSCVATLLGEYMVDLLKESAPPVIDALNKDESHHATETEDCDFPNCVNCGEEEWNRERDEFKTTEELAKTIKDIATRLDRLEYRLGDVIVSNDLIRH